MKFTGEMTPESENRIQACDRLLADPARLAALRRTRLMSTPKEKAFDRLAELAAKILKVPLTIVSFIDQDKQFFKAAYGLPSPYDETRETPIDESICRYILRGDEFIASDVKQDPILKIHPTCESWGIAAIIAIPMITKTGHVLGAFCAVDTKVRQWQDEDIFLMRELTASVMTEVELRSQIYDLEIERDLRERFVTALSHDLRTPLTVAMSASDLLMSSDTPAQDKPKIAQMIADSMGRADQMIRDLLDNSRIKAGEKIYLELGDCNLNDIAQKTAETLSRIQNNQIHVVATENVRGIWDSNNVRRMIENLVSNAAKYGASKAPVTIRIGKENSMAVIAVHNHGDPIGPENLKKLFEMFHRESSAIKGSKKGWGIGLTLVKGFAEAMGGHVTVTSTQEHGTTFTIYLPMIATQN